MRIFRAAYRDYRNASSLFHKYRLFYRSDALLADSNKFLLQRLTDNNAIIFLAEDHGKTVGFAQLYGSQSSVRATKELILQDLYVEESYRGRGAGSALIKKCLQHASINHFARIKLETASQNVEAQGLYKKFGFSLETDFQTFSRSVELLEEPGRAAHSGKSAKSTTKEPPLAPKHVVITGVTQGLGEAMVKKFSLLNWVVLGCGRNRDKLESLSKEYPNSDFTPVDVSHPYSVQEWINVLLETYGVPAFVINNASLIDSPRKPMDRSTDLTQIQKIIEVNLLGTIQVCHGFLPYMKAKPGKTVIVNMSSGWGRTADAGLSGYCASKFGVEGFSQTVAKENQGKVTIVTLDPGNGIATPMLKQFADEAYYHSAPTPDEWAEIAVPYILKIGPDQSGKSLTCPEIKRAEFGS